MMRVMILGRAVWLVVISNNGLVQSVYEVKSNYHLTIKNKESMSGKTKILVKDLPAGTSLKGLKLKTNKGVIGYVFSEFDCGVFFNDVPGEGTDRGKLYPQVVGSKEQIKGWEVINDDKIKPNCDSLTTLNYIMNE